MRVDEGPLRAGHEGCESGSIEGRRDGRSGHRGHHAPAIVVVRSRRGVRADLGGAHGLGSWLDRALRPGARRSVDVSLEAADGARGDAGGRIEHHEARAAVRAAEELAGGRGVQAALAAHRARAQAEGCCGGT